VSGRTEKLVQAARGSARLSAATNTRSARVSLGREARRRRIANSWRRTRISSSFERRCRPSSQTSANRFRTTRYTNDQTKQPSLDHDYEHPNLATFGDAADEFANPTGLSNAEIGRELYISDTTVKTHITHILHKLDLRDGVQAIVLAYQPGLFTDDR